MKAAESAAACPGRGEGGSPHAVALGSQAVNQERWRLLQGTWSWGGLHRGGSGLQGQWPGPSRGTHPAWGLALSMQAAAMALP